MSYIDKMKILTKRQKFTNAKLLLSKTSDPEKIYFELTYFDNLIFILKFKFM